MLPVFFALAIVVAWFKSPQGSPEFIDILKRAVISSLLLAAFPEISKAILFIAEGITERIDHLNGIDTVIRMAQEKSESISFSLTGALLQFNELLIATLSFLSYMLLYIARYLMIAMYHFFWAFYIVSAPLLLLFNLFEGTQQVTVNLFKGMIEVACWKIVWAILGAMLSALAFGDAYQTEGGPLTLIVMNFVIAIAMLLTPMLVRSLIGPGLQSMSSAISPMAVIAMSATPAKAASSVTVGRQALNNPKEAFKEHVLKIRPDFKNQFNNKKGK
jgi:hypothetical protein